MTAGRSAALTAGAYLAAAGATAALWDSTFYRFPFTLFFATAAVTAATGRGRAGVAVAGLGVASVAHLANDAGPSVLVPGAVLVGVAALIAHLACARRAGAAALAAERERLAMALELADLGTWELDPATGAMRWCERCRAVFGVPPGAPAGYDDFLARIHPGDRDGVAAANARALETAGPHEYDTEYRVVRPDGTVRWVAAMGRSVPADGGRRLIGTVLDVTARKDHDRRAAVAEERERVARELHDTLAQAFTGIVLHLEAADQAIDRRPDAVRARLAKASALARASLAEARRSVWAFRPRALEGRDLPGALRALVQESAGGPAVTFTTTGPPVALAAEVEDHVLRVAQEALTNALRHARAGTIAVELASIPNGVTLRVRDDGVGFDFPAARGFGLRGMHERAERVAGGLAVLSRPGAGTEVVLTVPAGPAPEQGKG